jgi:hypothetical protein
MANESLGIKMNQSVTFPYSAMRPKNSLDVSGGPERGCFRAQHGESLEGSLVKQCSVES